MKVIVIGAGASGIIAALKASENNEVVLLERNDKIGKKLQITGNGKCNYWNDEININNYYTDNYDTLSQILNSKDETFTYLLSLGIYPRKKNNLYYPYSNSANSIITILKKQLELKKVKIIYNAKVLDIIHQENFMVVTEDQTYYSDAVIVACGAKSYPKTGSDGSILDSLTKFNFKINPFKPALTALKVDKKYIKDLEGLRIDAKTTLLINDKQEASEVGELQFNENNVSGICIFNLSNIVSKNPNCEAELLIDFLYDIDSLDNWFNNQIKIMHIDQIGLILESLLNYKLLNKLLKECNLTYEESYQSLSEIKKKQLFNFLKNFHLVIDGTNDFETSQVSSGGISLNEINPLTMETYKVKNLYIIGELLDVNGNCGGFNLAFAWMSGFIVGSNVNYL